MKNPWRILSWAGAVLALALVLIGIEVLRFGGAFRSVQPAFAGRCRTIELGGSSEDIQVDPVRGLAYLSLLDRVNARRDQEVIGTVMLLDLNLPRPTPRAALAYDPQTFRPHGLSLLPGGSQPARLFAISHRPDASHTVEIAEEAPSGGFFPKESLRHEMFTHPNAIAAVGPRQFYLSNDTVARGSWTRGLQALFRVGGSTLIFFDGSRARVVASDLRSPAGLALSPDSSRLYVAQMLGRSLRVYRREAATGALTLEETVELGAAPGNLNVDSDGVVWIAVFPQLLSIARHLRDSRRLAPTQILRFDARQPRPAAGSSDPRLTTAYANAGAEISAGSAAAHWRDEFLIGALLDKKVLICKPSP